MATVDQGYAAWLRAEQLTTTLATPAAPVWGEAGATATIATPFADRAAAQAMAQFFAELLGAPLVQDRAIVPGERRDLLGRCLRLSADQLGYAAGGEIVIVVGVAEQANGTTELTVLRRLA